jgi:hypothetical protein
MRYLAQFDSFACLFLFVDTTAPIAAPGKGKRRKRRPKVRLCVIHRHLHVLVTRLHRLSQLRLLVLTLRRLRRCSPTSPPPILPTQTAGNKAFVHGRICSGLPAVYFCAPALPKKTQHFCMNSDV